MRVKSSTLVKSRKWNEPVTRITVTKDSIFQRMILADFLDALKKELLARDTSLIDAAKVDLDQFRDFMYAVNKEIGSVAFTFRKETFQKQFEAAVNEVLKYKPLTKDNITQILREKSFGTIFDDAVKAVLEGM